MTAKPVKVAFLADTADLRSNLKRAEEAMDSAATEAKSAGQKIDGAFDSTAESADNVASKGSQAAGALSGLGELVGGKFGAAMQAGGVGMQAFADAGDLVNVVTESNIVRKLKDTAVTVAQRTATLAKAAADRVAATGAKAWAAAQWVLNAALSANPIGLVILAIVALVAVFVVAWKKSEKFRAVVTKAWNAIKAATAAVWDWIKSKLSSVWNWITGAGKKLVTLQIAAWKLVFDKTREIWTKVVDLVRDKVSALVDRVKAIKDKVVSAVTGAGRWLYDTGKAVIQGLIDGLAAMWEKLKEWGSKIKDAVTFDIPGFGRSVAGRVAASSTPLALGGAGSVAVVYNITVEAPVGSSPADIGRTITRYIDAYEKAGGRRRA